MWQRRTWVGARMHGDHLLPPTRLCRIAVFLVKPTFLSAAEDVDGRVFQLGKQMWAGLVDMVVTWCRRRCGWARPRG